MKENPNDILDSFFFLTHAPHINFFNPSFIKQIETILLFKQENLQIQSKISPFANFIKRDMLLRENWNIKHQQKIIDNLERLLNETDSPIIESDVDLISMLYCNVNGKIIGQEPILLKGTFKSHWEKVLEKIDYNKMPSLCELKGELKENYNRFDIDKKHSEFLIETEKKIDEFYEFLIKNIELLQENEKETKELLQLWVEEYSPSNFWEREKTRKIEKILDKKQKKKKIKMNKYKRMGV